MLHKLHLHMLSDGGSGCELGTFFHCVLRVRGWLFGCMFSKKKKWKMKMSLHLLLV